jgi:hypothetical protein
MTDLCRTARVELLMLETNLGAAARSCNDLLADLGLWFYDSDRRFCERLCQRRWLTDLNLGFIGDISLFSYNICGGPRDRHLDRNIATNATGTARAALVPAAPCDRDFLCFFCVDMYASARG